MSLLSFFINIDKNLLILIQNYGFFAYPILFIVIFCETGLVVTPFFPGDSLLFTAGALASQGALSLFWLILLVSIAAILGDSVNYWIGKHLGKRLANSIKPEYLERTHCFYEKHGGKTIILARFIPIVRTFAPFIAGLGKMSYSKFLSYNIIGGILWTFIFIFAGFFFGTLPFVKNNFTGVILAVIFISLIPVVIEYFGMRKKC